LHSAQTARKAAFHDRLGDWSVDDLTSLAQLLDRLNESYAHEQPVVHDQP
jgi:hypothetical protein